MTTETENKEYCLYCGKEVNEDVVRSPYGNPMCKEHHDKVYGSGTSNIDAIIRSQKHDASFLEPEEEPAQLDFYVDVTQADWKRKYGEVFAPDSGEVLAHVVLTPRDFTRRTLNVKMTHWFGQYSKSKYADFILDALTFGAYKGLHGCDSSWFRLRRT